jgi:hypothetical protein
VSQKNTVFLRFLAKIFQNFFFKNRMKISLMGDLKKNLKNFHQKTQKYGFFWLILYIFMYVMGSKIFHNGHFITKSGHFTMDGFLTLLLFFSIGFWDLVLDLNLGLGLSLGFDLSPGLSLG